MEISYKRQFQQSYLKIENTEEAQRICEFMMLAENQINGLRPFEVEVADGRGCFWYDITGQQSLGDYMSRKHLTADILQLLFSSLDEICCRLPLFLLEEEALVLSGETIFLNFACDEISFLYLPGREGDIRGEFQQLMEEILQFLDHTDKTATAMAYEMYQLSLQRSLSLSEMVKEVQKRQEENNLPVIRQSKPVPAVEKRREEVAQKIPEDEGTALQTFVSSKLQSGRSWFSGHGLARKQGNPICSCPEPEAESHAECGQEIVHPTELLWDETSSQRKLVYQGRGEKEDIVLGETPLVIGKRRQEVDHCITSRSISRVHARIEKSEDIYYLEDLNSTNGTWLNGERLEYHEKVPLQLRDLVSFGTETYQFL